MLDNLTSKLQSFHVTKQEDGYFYIYCSYWSPSISIQDDIRSSCDYVGEFLRSMFTFSKLEYKSLPKINNAESCTEHENLCGMSLVRTMRAYDVNRDAMFGSCSVLVRPKV